MRDSSGNVLGTRKSARCGPWAGGYVTGFSMSNDGKTMVHSTDVGGGYVWGEADTMWRHVIGYHNYDIDSLTDPSGYNNADGTFAIDIAPSNKNIGYVIFRGRIFKTTDQFKTVTLLGNNLYFRAHSNGNESRLSYDRMKIDPINPNAVMFSTMGQGVYYSIDGGTTFTLVSNIPLVTVPDGGGIRSCIMDVNRAGATANTRKSHWALWVPGSGLWETTTGVNGTWSKSSLTNGPPVSSNMNQVLFDRQGNLILVAGAGGTYERRGGAWTKVSSIGATSCAVFPDTDAKFQSCYDGVINFTIPAAPNAWTSDAWSTIYPVKNGIQYEAADPRWLNTKDGYLIPAKLYVDPVNPKKLWHVHGTGICWTTAPTSFSEPVVWHDQSIGNAMLVTVATLFTPEGNLLRAAHDKPVWNGVTDEEIDNPETWYPSAIFNHGWDVDFVPGKSNVVVCIANGANADTSGISSDGGKTFTKFAQGPYGGTVGGAIAFVSDLEGYILPSLNARALRTVDGGKSWLPFQLTTMSGIAMPTSGGQGWGFSQYVNRKNIYASRSEPGVCYAYNSGFDPDQVATRGFYRKEAGSYEFKQIVSGDIGGFGWQHWQMAIIEIPGAVGDILMTAYNNDNPSLMRSTDRGATWNEVTTKVNGVSYPIKNVYSLGFGAAAPGSPYKTCRLCGIINGEYGIWESTDKLVSFTKIDARPEGMTYAITGGIAGHPVRYGEWYYGIGQMGWAKASQDHIIRLS